MAKQGLDKKMNFGMYEGLTPRQIIDDKGDVKYINYMTDVQDFYFSRETYDYIKTKEND